MTLGQRIREQRLRCGLSQKEISLVLKENPAHLVHLA